MAKRRWMSDIEIPPVKEGASQAYCTKCKGFQYFQNQNCCKCNEKWTDGRN